MRPYWERLNDAVPFMDPGATGVAALFAADIEAAYNALKDAAHPRIHTFINASDIQIEYQLQSTREDVLGQARAAVAHAKRYVDDVEFSPMDATRGDVDYIGELVKVDARLGHRFAKSLVSHGTFSV